MIEKLTEKEVVTEIANGTRCFFAKDLSNLNLRKLKAPGVQFLSCDLSNTDLRDSNLAGASIHGNLNRANFIRANLEGARLTTAVKSFITTSHAKTKGAFFGKGIFNNEV